MSWIQSSWANEWDNNLSEKRRGEDERHVWTSRVQPFLACEEPHRSNETRSLRDDRKHTLFSKQDRSPFMCSAKASKANHSPHRERSTQMWTKQLATQNEGHHNRYDHKNSFYHDRPFVRIKQNNVIDPYSVRRNRGNADSASTPLKMIVASVILDEVAICRYQTDHWKL